MEYLSGEKGSKYPLLILKSPETDSERVHTLEVLFWDICFVIVIDEDDKSTEETFLFDKLMYKFDLSLFLIVDSPKENNVDTADPDGRVPTQTFETDGTAATFILKPSSLIDTILL